ncbi:4Fe-4S ferredoxin-type, iron-sulphur binding domain [Moorella glycerini]|uniref:4Fe-4S binding domain protein n=1 Tax=Neomoorella stamsii TaxID=1266720 RepID=A0A9X7J0U8_9FIRM|nr:MULTISPECIES: 4Fe-4S dicluster domain-containing protein [Moorella]PRR70388.1 4Fe-4S binding domain protein [Moorella stamsii]CEP66393.1 4Fe-4S ferredoxin-type, iron-sulphur binding domain [Moorella glycerini]
MPPRVNLAKCDGCKAEKEPLCEQICPGDLMTLNPENQKAYCRSPRDCWDCMSCVKSCPQGAIETRLPYQIGYYQAKLIPLMGTNRITWTCIDINGKVERFSFKTRND